MRRGFSRIRCAGQGEVREGPNWGSYIVHDDRLISGQNPASSASLADAVLAELA
jgi:putative intracellular protease/amidase